MTDSKGTIDDFAWSPDAKRIVLVIHDPDPREPEKKEKDKKTVPPIVIDRIHFKQDIDGYITDRYSLVEVPEEIADDVIAALAATKIKGKRVQVRRDRDEG